MKAAGRLPALSVALLLAGCALTAAVASTPATPSPAQAASEALSPAPDLSQVNAALQAGEADKALALLASAPQSGSAQAEALNLRCRVHLTLEQWDAAAADCEQAAHLDPQNSDYNLWLGRALGQKAARASFLTAYSLAKRTRAQFEESVRLDPRNAPALSDLGNFYRQAPGVVGGGIDKAQAIAAQLDKVDPGRAHALRAQIAEQQKDYPAAERELKQSISLSPHPAIGWTTLAGFYSHRQRFTDMEAAVHSAFSTAIHDKHAGVALYDSAGLLIETGRDPSLAATMLDDYLAGPSKTEEAPAFIAHFRLARLKQKLGDPAAADKERAAALALAHDYKPAQDLRAQATTP
jgi:tetratricopeptide (TPR) repeat protein